MEFMEGFTEDCEENNRCIQRALREIEENALGNMLCGLDDRAAAAIRRNLSRRADEWVTGDIEARRNSIGSGTIQRAREDFMRRLLKFRKYSGIEESSPQLESCAALESPKEILDFFIALSSRIQAEGLSALEGVSVAHSENLAEKGLGYLVDGLDPMLIRALLVRLKDARMAALETRLDMIIEGFDALASHDMTGIVAEKLKAFIPFFDDDGR